MKGEMEKLIEYFKFIIHLQEVYIQEHFIEINIQNNILKYLKELIKILDSRWKDLNHT